MAGAGDSTAWGGVAAESVASPSPNQGVQATANSVRSCLAPAVAPPRLSASVAMTSNVKSREPLFLGLHAVYLAFVASEEPEPGRDDG